MIDERLAHAPYTHVQGLSFLPSLLTFVVSCSTCCPLPPLLLSPPLLLHLSQVTMGLPGLAMLLPYPSAYGAWRRIVVTRKRTYTASMMKRLMGDIGDSVTSHAWPKVQELDKVLAGGAVPGVATYCMYGECHSV